MTEASAAASRRAEKREGKRLYISELEEKTTSLRGSDVRAPCGLERLASRSDGCVDVLLGRGVDCREELLSRWVKDLERLAQRKDEGSELPVVSRNCWARSRAHSTVAWTRRSEVSDLEGRRRGLPYDAPLTHSLHGGGAEGEAGSSQDADPAPTLEQQELTH